MMYSGWAKLQENDADNEHSSFSDTWPNSSKPLLMLRSIGNDQPVSKPVRISVLQKRFSDNVVSYHDSRPPCLEEEDESDLDEEDANGSYSGEEESFYNESKLVSSTFNEDETNTVLQASYTHPLSSKQHYKPFSGLSGSSPRCNDTPLKFSRGLTAATPQSAFRSMERLSEPVTRTPRSTDAIGTKNGNYITPYKTMVLGPRPGQNELVRSNSKSSRTLTQQETLNAEILRTPFSEVRRSVQMNSANKRMTVINQPMTGEDKENVMNCIPTEMLDMHFQTPKAKLELFNQPKFTPGTLSGKKTTPIVSPFPTEHPQFKRPLNNALNFSERDLHSGINNWANVESQKQIQPIVNREPIKSDVHHPLPNYQGTIQDDKQGWESQNKEFHYPDRVNIKLESTNSKSVNDAKQPNPCMKREPLLCHEKPRIEPQSNDLAVGKIQLNHSETKDACYSERLESKVLPSSRVTCVGSESQWPVFSIHKERSSKEELFCEKPDFVPKPNNYVVLEDKKYLLKNCTNSNPKEIHYSVTSGESKLHSNNCVVVDSEKPLLNPALTRKSSADYCERSSINRQESLNHTPIGDQDRLSHHTSNRDAVEQKANFISSDSAKHLIVDSQKHLQNCTSHKELAEEQFPEVQGFNRPGFHNQKPLLNYMGIREPELPISQRRVPNIHELYKTPSPNDQTQLENSADINKFEKSKELHYCEKPGLIKLEPNNCLPVNTRKPLPYSTNSNVVHIYPEKPCVNKSKSINCVTVNEQRLLPNPVPKSESKEFYSERMSPSNLESNNLVPVVNQKMFLNPTNRELEHHAEKLGFIKLEPNNCLSVNNQKPLPNFANSELVQIHPEKPSVNKSKFINCVTGNEQRLLPNLIPKSESKELYSEKKSPSNLESNNFVPHSNKKLLVNPMNRELERQHPERLGYSRFEHNNLVSACDPNQLPNPTNRESKGADLKKSEFNNHAAVNNASQLPHPTHKESSVLHSDTKRSDHNAVLEQNNWMNGEEQSQQTPTVQWTSAVESIPVLRFKDKVFLKLSKLGVGGSSEVYRVVDQKSSKLLAVKCVDLSSTDPETARGYLNEVQLLLRLQHKDTVIRLFDHEYLKKEERLYMIMEHGDTDLAKLIRSICLNKKVPMMTILYYWTEMLKAVQDIHSEGVIHADLKPANFLMVCGRLKLIDFGIASSVRPEMTSTFKNTPAGTYNYMSPEVIQDPGSANPRSKIGFKSDVWSLGCILYNLLYGRTPFQHIQAPYLKLSEIVNPKHSIKFSSVKECPTVLHQALKQCLQYEPKFRPTVAELIDLPYMWCGPIDST